MSTWIKWGLWLSFAGLIIVPNVVCAMLSEQHAEFLKLFFWDFPIMLVEMIIPGI